MADRVWNTASLREPEQFAFWREVVWDAFVPVTLTRPDDGGFAGAVTASGVGPIGVSAIASQAQTVERTESDVRRLAGDVFFLNLPVQGGSTVAQGGRTARLGAGDFAILNGSRPFRLEFEEEFKQVSLTLPHDLLAPLLAEPECSTAVAVHGDRGLGAIASSALRAMAQNAAPLEPELTRPLAERLASLIALSLGARTPAAGSSRGAIMQAALDEIERSLSDTELSPALVAERVGVSTRYLHQLFARRGPSFGRYLLSRRLARCAEDLSDPRLATLTIGEIGWRSGFADPSYFSRAFRRRYGLTPREHRRRAGTSGSQAEWSRAKPLD